MKRWDTIEVGGSPIRVYLGSPKDAWAKLVLFLKQHLP